MRKFGSYGAVRRRTVTYYPDDPLTQVYERPVHVSAVTQPRVQDVQRRGHQSISPRRTPRMDERLLRVVVHVLEETLPERFRRAGLSD